MAALRPLIINDDIKENIAALVANAEMHPVTVDDMLDLKNGEKKPVGDNWCHTLLLPFGYRIVFSIENWPRGKQRHMSMSVDEDKKLPNMEAVKEIMRLIGYRSELEKCYVYLEDIAPNRKAINIIERIKP